MVSNAADAVWALNPALPISTPQGSACRSKQWGACHARRPPAIFLLMTQAMQARPNSTATATEAALSLPILRQGNDNPRFTGALHSPLCTAHNQHIRACKALAVQARGGRRRGGGGNSQRRRLANPRHPGAAVAPEKSAYLLEALREKRGRRGAKGPQPKVPRRDGVQSGGKRCDGGVERRSGEPTCCDNGGYLGNQMLSLTALDGTACRTPSKPTACFQPVVSCLGCA